MGYYPGMGMYNQPQYNAASNGLQWVQGEAGAKSYLVAPNSSVLLMDSEKSVFYIKSADPAGMPMPLRVFDYTERVQRGPELAPTAAQNSTKVEFVNREEFNALSGQYSALQEKYNALTDKVSALEGRKAKKEEQQ